MTSHINKIDFIIFDCDGTLVDSEPITTGIIADMMAEIGIIISKKECHDRFVGTKFVDIAQYISDHGISIDPVAFEKKYRATCDVLFTKELKPIEGVEEVLSALPIDYCIASNGPKEKMKVTLKATGLDRYFPSTHIFSAYDIQRWKPEPHLFLHAASTHDYLPESSLVIEDTIHGILAAVTGGLPVIGVNVKSDLNEVKALNIPIFNNMKEVKEYLFNDLALV